MVRPDAHKSLVVLTLLLAFLCGRQMVSHAQMTITMEEDRGVYKVPCKVNGMKLKFIFDTGSSRVSISSMVANMMLENGYLSQDDIQGAGQSVVADGKLIDHTIVILRTVEIGGVVLNDVEAVVVYEQSAPLLLGQSAIQKLGKVSLQGNQMIIQPAPKFSDLQDMVMGDIEGDRLWEVFSEAYANYESGYFELASEQFAIIYDKQPEIIMEDYDLYHYAECLRMTGKKEDALEIYIQTLMGGLELTSEMTGRFYHGLQKCYHELEDYQSSLKYGQLAYQYIEFPSDLYEGVTCMLAHTYDKMGNLAKAQEVCQKAIDRYLEFVDVASTDCWERKYYDKYLAKLYLDMSEFTPEGDMTFAYKYLTISAAWGNPEAVEFCRKFNIPYTTKPHQYVY